MNTYTELIDNGIGEYTATRMLDDYKSKIGTMNGVYEITDIYYDFDVRGKIVTLKCTECGKVIQRVMISGRNKWSELIKSCECEKIKKALAKAELQKISKLKKAPKPKPIKQPYVPTYKYDDSYIGRKNNRLTVLAIVKGVDGKRKFECLCDCGNKHIVKPTMWENGMVKSCGCLSKEYTLQHSPELDRLRVIYNGMIQRCYNTNSTSYENYGGRGITICKEWLEDREKFIEWALNNGYSSELSIDRINVNGNYEPSNCRWADWYTQANNRRPKEEWKKRKKQEHSRKMIEYRGVKYPADVLYEKFNTSQPAISYRMNKLGMTLEQALETPKKCNGRPRKQVV